MKITRSQWCGTTFDSLNVGDVFCMARCIYIKTDMQGGHNAVELTTGLHRLFFQHTDVTTVDAELVLR